MPIIIKDFSWYQTTTSVTIIIPLKGIHPSKIDVFTSSQYIKISYCPYFFEVLLEDLINPKVSRCTFVNGTAVLELVKVESKSWSNLESNLGKKEKNDLKKKCLENEFKEIQENESKRRNKKSELKRIAVSEQISLDTKNRQNVEKIKESEKNKALGNLINWQNSLKENLENEIDCKEESDIDEDFEFPEIVETSEISSKVPADEKIFCPIRTSQLVEVTFSEREFPTPSRESRLQEENEWLRKQAEAKRTVGFDSDDLRPEEKNPQFLKLKGDEFFKKKNYLGAISAYSFGIKLSKNYVDLYISRSKVQYECGNYFKCVKDCSTALELLKPEVELNLEQRYECIVRRGIALYKIGRKENAASEIRAAMQLFPNNIEKKEELERMLEEIYDDD